MTNLREHLWKMCRMVIVFCVLYVISFTVVIKCDEASPAEPQAAADAPPEEPTTDANAQGETPVAIEEKEPPAGTPPVAEPEAPAPAVLAPEPQAAEADKPEVLTPAETTEAPVTAAPKPAEVAAVKKVDHEFLKYINKARAKGSLNDLVWDDTLEKDAQAIGVACVKTKESSKDNLIVEYKKVKKLNPKKVFKKWLRQSKKAKGGNTKRCCNNKKTSCCRFAMVMSPQFKSVGCGYNFCKKVRGGKRRYRNTFSVVCLFKK